MVEELAPPRVIHNPISGERIEIRTSGAQTDGRQLASISSCRQAATCQPPMLIPSRLSGLRCSLASDAEVAG